MTRRIRVTGGPWPERHGAEGVIVDRKRDEYPWSGLGNAEVVILLDDDPLVPPERRHGDWTCAINASDVEYLGPG